MNSLASTHAIRRMRLSKSILMTILFYFKVVIQSVRKVNFATYEGRWKNTAELQYENIYCTISAVASLSTPSYFVVSVQCFSFIWWMHSQCDTLIPVEKRLLCLTHKKQLFKHNQDEAIQSSVKNTFVPIFFFLNVEVDLEKCFWMFWIVCLYECASAHLSRKQSMNECFCEESLFMRLLCVRRTPYTKDPCSMIC